MAGFGGWPSYLGGVLVSLDAWYAPILSLLDASRRPQVKVADEQIVAHGGLGGILKAAFAVCAE